MDRANRQRVKGPSGQAPQRGTAPRGTPPRAAPARGAAGRRGPGPKRRRWGLLTWLIMIVVWGGLAGAGVLLWFAWDLPRPAAALDAARRPSLTLQDRSGAVFATFGDVVGDPLRLSDMPAYLPAAAVAVEDRRYWQHGGFDLLGILRAAWVDLRARRIVQGGSTIAQQVAKTLFLSNARTLRRKVQEVLLTLWLEQHFTKREILEIWLNRVYLGSGAWGVDAAAHIYFGVSARHVNLWQAAMIAGLPRAPSRFSPRVNPQLATARAREVLTAMAETGVITPAQAQAASAQIALPAPPPAAAGWFADWAAERAVARLPPGADAVVHTTLDLPMQRAVDARLGAMMAGPAATAGASQAAVVVLDATSGAVRAMAGGRDYRTSPYNRAVLARRQPGSTFKPFVWLAALEKGARPDDTVLDAPIRVGGWAPADYERHFLGPITLEEALAQSVNTAAVRLLLQAGGPRAVAAVAHRLGIADALPDDASLALGTGEVGLLEMAGAYASFFNGGFRVAPMATQALLADGRPVALGHAAPVRVVDPNLAAMMVRMMAAVVSRGTGRAAALAGHVVAGKTGTSQGYHDAWFIGWTGNLVIGVWMGNDDNAPMKGIVGGALPARLFHEIAQDIAR
ncbi:MAG: PBP1A family penicillin-binding protein [Rhodospirillales bacterium]|nr:PBP1A family penicillin-binding protein [Rhodospirillales bacterium]MDE2200486.1 PBP1A family penicillin-binding protein [Rhodospirillales bacterium]MDE2576996.1 PBP1A family penicillin-binding protein [Rhodospirillales bacterium]